MLRNVTGNFNLQTSSAEPIAIDLAIEYTNEVEVRGNIDRYMQISPVSRDSQPRRSTEP
jgi:hypothetical protein